MSKAFQLHLRQVEAAAFRAQRQRTLAYMRQHRAQYLTWARLITPDLGNDDQVWERLLFAILSAQERFDKTCAAFVALTTIGRLDLATWTVRSIARELRQVGLYSFNQKAQCVRDLCRDVDIHLQPKGNYPDPTWDAYARRLEKIRGLGIVKARFAACLLYPLEADLACIDTWLCRLFLGAPGTDVLTRPIYHRLERRIRIWSRLAEVPMFVGQWMIWDCTRGVQEDHSPLRFPGGHKDVRVV